VGQHNRLLAEVGCKHLQDLFIHILFQSEVSGGMALNRLHDVRQIFPKAEDNFSEVLDVSTVAVREKLDACVVTILCYASLDFEDALFKPENCKLLNVQCISHFF
jgi:hypothetical protein